MVIVPLTESRIALSPVLNIEGEPCTLTIQGNPNSLAMTAPWDTSKPICVANSDSNGKNGDHPISVQ